MASLNFTSIVLVAFALTIGIECSKADGDSTEGFIGDVVEGLSDRELILTLVKRIEELETWQKVQQEESYKLKSTVAEQEQEIADLKRRLTNKEQLAQEKQNFDDKDGSDDDFSHITEHWGSAYDAKVGRVHVPKGAPEPVAHRNGFARKNGGNTRLRQIRDRRHSRRQIENTEKVAFFATPTGQLSNLGAGQILEFDNVTINIGNAYSPHTGAFTAPLTGVYVFSVSIMGQARRETHYYVSKNGAEVSRLYIHGSESPYTTTSHTVIVQLTQGDDVEIRNADAGEGIYGSHFSCFSGFLLYLDDSDNSVIIG